MTTALKKSLKSYSCLKKSPKLTPPSISWIGGHADIEGNEIADVAAKEGAKLKTTPLSKSITLKSI